MKSLDFPNSAAAVRLHGREYHDQDFLSGTTPDAAGLDAQYDWQPAAGSGLGKTLRWTAICVGLAFASAAALSWLVRPDTPQVSLVNFAKPDSTATNQAKPTPLRLVSAPR